MAAVLEERAKTRKVKCGYDGCNKELTIPGDIKLHYNTEYETPFGNFFTYDTTIFYCNRTHFAKACEDY